MRSLVEKSFSVPHPACLTVLGACLALGMPAAAWAHASLYWFGGAVRSNTTYYHVGNTSVADDAELTLPSSGRLRDLRVVCDAALGTGTYTYTAEVNGAATPLSCNVSAGECANTHDHADFQSGDQIRLAVVPSTDPEPDVSLPCRVSASIFAAGSDVLAHNSTLSWGSIAAAAPADGSFCGPAGGLKEGPQQCNAAAPDAAAFLMPAGATLAGLAVHLGSAAASDETYTLHNITHSEDSDLAVTVPAGSQQALSTQCSSNCEPAAGDLLTVRFNTSDAAANTTRHVAVEFGSIGTIIPVRGTAEGTDTTFGNSQLPWMTSAIGAAYRLPRGGRLQNLRVQAEAAPNTAVTVTLCAGSTNPPDCSGPSCTLGTDVTTCANTKGGLEVSHGELFELQLSPAGSTLNLGAAFEIVDLPCVGDCHDNHDVTVSDLLTMVNIALGTGSIETCTAGDANQDGRITVNEIVSAVNSALSSCP